LSAVASNSHIRIAEAHIGPSVTQVLSQIPVKYPQVWVSWVFPWVPDLSIWVYLILMSSLRQNWAGEKE